MGNDQCPDKFTNDNPGRARFEEEQSGRLYRCATALALSSREWETNRQIAEYLRPCGSERGKLPYASHFRCPRLLPSTAAKSLLIVLMLGAAIFTGGHL